MRTNSYLGKFSSLRKYLTFFIVVFWCFSSFGNNIPEINKSGEIEFFNIEKVENPKLHKSYFHSFCLDFNKGINPKNLHLIFPINDDTRVYIPLKDGTEKEIKVGLLYSNNWLAYDWQVGLVKIDLQDVDLNKPIKIEIIPKTIIGIAQINEKIRIAIFDENPKKGESYLKFERQESIKSFFYHLLLGMILISFVYFLVHYFVMKQIHFLFYAAYLFFLIFNYGYRTPFLYHIYNPIHQSLYIFIDVNSQMLAFLGYFLFLIKFLNIENELDKFNSKYKFVIGFFIALILIDNFFLFDFFFW